MSYAKRMLNQEDRPFWPQGPIDKVSVNLVTVKPTEFVYQEPFTINEVRGVCFRLNRRIKDSEALRQVRNDNGRCIEIPLSHEQLRLLPGGTVPGRTRRPVKDEP